MYKKKFSDTVRRDMLQTFRWFKWFTVLWNTELVYCFDLLNVKIGILSQIALVLNIWK